MNRKIITGLIASVIFTVMNSFSIFSYVTNKLADDLLKQLGIAEPALKTSINNSFFSGYINHYGARNIKNIVTGDREAVTTDLLNYVKLQVSSASFQKDYQQYRDREKAKLSPPVPAITREELTTKKIAEAEKTLKTFQDLLKTATDPAVIKSYKEQVDFWNKAIADYRSGKSDQIRYELSMAEDRYKTEKESYVQEMKKWEIQYPQPADQFIKLRLKEFLEISKDIDYNAVLADKNNKKVFVNPVYEKKGARWKMGFRAGREVTETARKFAQKWLAELKN